MKIDIIPDDGHWVIVRGFHLLKNKGRRCSLLRSPGIPEWRRVGPGERRAANSNDAKRFNTKLQVQTYLDDSPLVETEQTALTDSDRPTGSTPTRSQHDGPGPTARQRSRALMGPMHDTLLTKHLPNLRKSRRRDSPLLIEAAAGDAAKTFKLLKTSAEGLSEPEAQRAGLRRARLLLTQGV